MFQGRSVAIRKEYDDRIEKANELDLLGFGLSAFRQDYGQRFRDLAKTKKIRILLLDTHYPNDEAAYARQRDIEEGNLNGRIVGDIEEFISFSRPITKEYPENFNVRVMRALPSINYFRLDDEILWGPYLINMQSRNMPTFLVGKGGYLYETLKEHFNTLWSDERFSRSI